MKILSCISSFFNYCRDSKIVDKTYMPGSLITQKTFEEVGRIVEENPKADLLDIQEIYSKQRNTR